MSKDHQNSYAVLVVEDNVDQLNQLKEKLASDSAFPSKIDCATSLKDAVSRLKKKKYHLVLAALRIDSKPAIRLFEEVKKMELKLPFVLMTEVGDDQLVREAMKAGIAECIVRSPGEFEQLSRKLKECYDRFCETNEKRVAPLNTTRDDLTGLYTHSYLHQRMVEEFSKATRYQYPLSCLMLDIDHFKNLNEEQGYRIGDELLKQTANLLFDSCRLTDLIARYGGEEFAIILPHIDYQGAFELAKRLRLLFAEKKFLAGSKKISLTVSLGIASFPDDGITRRGDLLRFTTKALYHAKAGGRNRVILYRDIVPHIVENLPELKMEAHDVEMFRHHMMEVADSSRKAYLEACTVLVKAIESKDPMTAGHGASCVKYSKMTAEEMGIASDDVEIIANAALLHDIGKICIADEILLKPARLTMAEFEIMKEHTYFGYRILKPIKFLREEAELVLHHHEWFNGEGYPCRLKGTDIPVGARIIAVVDSYDTMRKAGGRYKKTISATDAVNELINCSGIQFDAVVVKAFIEVLKRCGEFKGEYLKDKLEETILSQHKN